MTGSHGTARRGLRRVLHGCLGACVVAGAQPAAAGTWAMADWYFGGVHGASSGPNVASVPLQNFDLFTNGTVVGTVTAAAQAGQLQLGTSASFSTLNTTPIIVSEAVSRATAEAADLLTAHGLPAGTPGYIVFKGVVSGTNAATLSGTTGGQTTTTITSVATSLIGFRTDALNATPADGNYPDYDWPVFLPLFTNAEHAQVPVELAFPITYETPAGFYFFLKSEVRIQFDPTVAVTFEGASDFLDTFVLTAVELRDGARAVVPGASLTALSGTVYPGVGNVTTTTTMPAGATTTTVTGTTTTTTQPPGCAGLAGLAHAECLLAAAVAGPLCADAIPPRVEQALQARLEGARKAVTRAVAATGRKQVRLVTQAERRLEALAARARAAARSRNARKRITPACADAVQALAAAATADLT